MENSLHPQAQRRFIQYLIKCARRKRLQIILSTHSPFVLEELPPISRIMLQQLSDQKNIVYDVSTQYALNVIDDVEHPLMYIHVEDKEAITLFWNIIKSDKRIYEELIKKIKLLPVGSYSVVRVLNDLAESGKLPYNGISVVDGDKVSECSGCIGLPGTLAPEVTVFSGLKSLNWNKLDDRFGIGAGSLFKYFEDAMLDPDHHNWTTYVGDKIKQSCDTVWDIMTDEWCKQCLGEDIKQEFIQQIKTKCDQFSEN